MTKFGERIQKKKNLLPIIFNMGILPLVVKMYVFDTHLNQFSWYSVDGQGIDLFNYYKQVLFLCSSVLMLFLIIWNLIDRKKREILKKQFVLLPLCVYCMFVILSTVFSKYSWFSTHGMISHFETIYVILGYGITVVYAILWVRDETDVEFILKGWSFCLVPMILLGFSQILQCDFYSTEFGKNLYLTKEAISVGQEIKLVFGKGRVYLSLFNPNYVGSFCILCFPVLLTLGLWGKGKRIRLLNLVLATGIIICIMGALAKTAFLILPIVLLLFVLLLRRDIINKKGIFLIAGVALLMIFLGTSTASGGHFFRTLKSALIATGTGLEYDLEEMETWQDQVKVVYKGKTLYIRSVLNNEGMMGFIIKDENGGNISGQEIEDEETGIKFVLNDPLFSEISLIPVEIKTVPSFSIRIKGEDYFFSNYTGYEGCFFYSPYGRFMKIGTAPSIGFKSYEKSFTNRGYIWSRTLPLLKDHLLLGSGPDTFLLEFPQYDYLNRSRFLNGELVSKPHNLYLQMAVQTGVLSTLFFMVFYLLYLIQSLRLYWCHGSDSVLSRIGVSLCTATAGYMAIGITTDSTINVAPLYWSMMGLGLAVNKIIRQKM